MPRECKQGQNSTHMQQSQNTRASDLKEGCAQDTDLQGNSQPRTNARLVVEDNKKSTEKNAQKPWQPHIGRGHVMKLKESEEDEERKQI